MKLIYHPIFLEHKLENGNKHIENPKRLKLILEKIKNSYELAKNGENELNLVHDEKYIYHVKTRTPAPGAINFPFSDHETYLAHKSYEAACYAAGASIQAAKHAMKNKTMFALVRPPGHHASLNKGHGFCIFNNVAIAAEYAARKGEKVMILDIDLHHGDGTEEHVTNSNFRKNLFYFSIHQKDIFPNTGLKDVPHVKNIPLDCGEKNTISDAEYISIVKKSLPALINHFKPTMIAVSAGFDTHKKDHEEFGELLGGRFELTKKSYEYVRKVIEEHKLKYFCVLEGGYNPESVLDGVSSFVD